MTIPETNCGLFLVGVLTNKNCEVFTLASQVFLSVKVKRPLL